MRINGAGSPDELPGRGRLGDFALLVGVLFGADTQASVVRQAVQGSAF